jgi:hypothetical protein
VVLVREVQEPVRQGGRVAGVMFEQARPQGQTFADRHPVVVVAVDDQHRRPDVGRERVRGVRGGTLRCHLASPVRRQIRRATELDE